MRSSLLTALLLATASTARAAELAVPDFRPPTIPAEAREASEFVPRGWVIEERASDDLDRDGRPDLVLVLRDSDPRNRIANPGGLGVDELDTNGRMLVIAFGKRGGRFLLGVTDHALIPRHVDPLILDPYSAIEVAHGRIRISLERFATAGSWTSAQVAYTLRFEAGCFRLIGYDRDETRRNTGATSAISVNYLTARVKESRGSIEDEARTHEWRALQGPRRVCLEHVGDGLAFQPER